MILRMPGRALLATVCLSLLAGLLAVGLARVGTELDQVRLERNDLRYDVEELRQDLDRVAGERQSLDLRVQDQTESIEQLKRQLSRAQHRALQASPALSAELTTDASATQ